MTLAVSDVTTQVATLTAAANTALAAYRISDNPQQYIIGKYIGVLTALRQIADFIAAG